MIREMHFGFFSIVHKQHLESSIPYIWYRASASAGSKIPGFARTTCSTCMSSFKENAETRK